MTLGHLCPEERQYEEWVLPPPKEDKGTPSVYKKRKKKVLRRNLFAQDIPPLPYVHKWTFGFNPETSILNLTTECRKAIAFCADNLVFIYNYEYHELHPLRWHANEVVHLANDRNATFLASCDNGDNCCIVIWDTYSFFAVRQIIRPADTLHEWIFLSCDGRLLVSMEAKEVGSMFVCWEWINETDTPKVLFNEPEDLEDEVQTFKFHEYDLRYMVVTYRANVVLIYMGNKRTAYHFPNPLDETEPIGDYNDSTFNTTADLLFTCTSTGHVIVFEGVVYEGEDCEYYDAVKKECVHQIPLQSCSIDVIQCLDNYIYTVNENGIISIYTNNLRLVRHLPNYGLGPLVGVYPNAKIGKENSENFSNYLKKTMSDTDARKKYQKTMEKLYVQNNDLAKRGLTKRTVISLKQTINELGSILPYELKCQEICQGIENAARKLVKYDAALKRPAKRKPLVDLVIKTFKKVKKAALKYRERKKGFRQWKKDYNNAVRHKKILRKLIEKEKRLIGLERIRRKRNAARRKKRKCKRKVKIVLPKKMPVIKAGVNKRDKRKCLTNVKKAEGKLMKDAKIGINKKENFEKEKKMECLMKVRAIKEKLMKEINMKTGVEREKKQACLMKVKAAEGKLMREEAKIKLTKDLKRDKKNTCLINKTKKNKKRRKYSRKAVCLLRKIKVLKERLTKEMKRKGLNEKKKACLIKIKALEEKLLERNKKNRKKGRQHDRKKIRASLVKKIKLLKEKIKKETEAGGKSKKKKVYLKKIKTLKAKLLKGSKKKYKARKIYYMKQKRRHILKMIKLLKERIKKETKAGGQSEKKEAYLKKIKKLKEKLSKVNRRKCKYRRKLNRKKRESLLKNIELLKEKVKKEIGAGGNDGKKKKAYLKKIKLLKAKLLKGSKKYKKRRKYNGSRNRAILKKIKILTENLKKETKAEGKDAYLKKINALKEKLLEKNNKNRKIRRKLNRKKKREWLLKTIKLLKEKLLKATEVEGQSNKQKMKRKKAYLKKINELKAKLLKEIKIKKRRKHKRKKKRARLLKKIKLLKERLMKETESEGQDEKKKERLLKVMEAEKKILKELETRKLKKEQKRNRRKECLVKKKSQRGIVNEKKDKNKGPTQAQIEKRKACLLKIRALKEKLLKRNENPKNQSRKEKRECLFKKIKLLKEKLKTETKAGGDTKKRKAYKMKINALKTKLLKGYKKKSRKQRRLRNKKNTVYLIKKIKLIKEKLMMETEGEGQDEKKKACLMKVLALEKILVRSLKRKILQRRLKKVKVIKTKARRKRLIIKNKLKQNMRRRHRLRKWREKLNKIRVFKGRVMREMRLKQKIQRKSKSLKNKKAFLFKLRAQEQKIVKKIRKIIYTQRRIINTKKRAMHLEKLQSIKKKLIEQINNVNLPMHTRRQKLSVLKRVKKMEGKLLMENKKRRRQRIKRKKKRLLKKKKLKKKKRLKRLMRKKRLKKLIKKKEKLCAIMRKITVKRDKMKKASNFEEFKKLLSQKKLKSRLLARRCNYWKYKTMKKVNRIFGYSNKKQIREIDLLHKVIRIIKQIIRYQWIKFGSYEKKLELVHRRMRTELAKREWGYEKVIRVPGSLERMDLVALRPKKVPAYRITRVLDDINTHFRQNRRKQKKHEVHVDENKYKLLDSDKNESTPPKKPSRKRIEFNRLDYDLGKLSRTGNQVMIKGGEIIGRKSSPPMKDTGNCHFKGCYRPELREQEEESTSSSSSSENGSLESESCNSGSDVCEEKSNNSSENESVATIGNRISNATYGSQETFEQDGWGQKVHKDYWYPPKKVKKKKKRLNGKDEDLQDKLYNPSWEEKNEGEIKFECDTFEVRDFIAINSLGQIAYLNSEKDYPHFLYYGTVQQISSVAIHPVYKFLCMATYDTLLLYDYNKKSLIHQSKIKPLSHLMPPELLTKLASELKESKYQVKPKCFRDKLIPRSTEITKLLYSPNGDTLACAMKDGGIIFVGPLTLKNQYMEPFEETTQEILFMKFTPDSLYLFFTNVEDTFYLAKMAVPPILVAKFKPHDSTMCDFIFCQIDPTNYTPYSLGHDRKLIEYDMNRSIFSHTLVVKKTVFVDATGIPTAICNCPSNNPFIVLIANDQRKVRIYDLSNYLCLKTVIMPELTIEYMKVIHVREQYILFFRDKYHMCFNMMPLDGNPYKWMTTRLTVDPLTLFVPDNDLNYFFTSTNNAPFIHMWKMDVMPFFSTQMTFDLKTSNYFSDLETTVLNEDLMENMIDYFYLAQLIHDGSYLKQPRHVTNYINACEVIDVMRALGYFPSEFEIKNILEELKLMNPGKGSLTNIKIYFEEFLKLFINHKPTKELSEEDLKISFELLNGSPDEDTFNYLNREEFLNILQTMGEPMTKLELFTYFKILTGERTTAHDVKVIKDDPEDLFDFLPKRITFQYFYEELLGFLKLEESKEKTGNLECKDVPEEIMSDEADEEFVREKKPEPKPEENEEDETKKVKIEKEDSDEKESDESEGVKESELGSRTSIKGVEKFGKERTISFVRWCYLKKEKPEDDTDSDSVKTDNIEAETAFWLKNDSENNSPDSDDMESEDDDFSEESESEPSLNTVY